MKKNLYIIIGLLGIFAGSHLVACCGGKKKTRIHPQQQSAVAQGAEQTGPQQQIMGQSAPQQSAAAQASSSVGRMVIEQQQQQSAPQVQNPQNLTPKRAVPEKVDPLAVDMPLDPRQMHLHRARLEQQQRFDAHLAQVALEQARQQQKHLLQRVSGQAQSEAPKKSQSQLAIPQPKKASKWSLQQKQKIMDSLGNIAGNETSIVLQGETILLPLEGQSVSDWEAIHRPADSDWDIFADFAGVRLLRSQRRQTSGASATVMPTQSQSHHLAPAPSSASQAATTEHVQPQSQSQAQQPFVQNELVSDYLKNFGPEYQQRFQQLQQQEQRMHAASVAAERERQQRLKDEGEVAELEQRSIEQYEAWRKERELQQQQTHGASVTSTTTAPQPSSQSQAATTSSAKNLLTTPTDPLLARSLFHQRQQQQTVDAQGALPNTQQSASESRAHLVVHQR